MLGLDELAPILTKARSVVGGRLEVFRKGCLIDSADRHQLGAEDAAAGCAAVSEVRERFSIARLEGAECLEGLNANIDKSGQASSATW